MGVDTRKAQRRAPGTAPYLGACGHHAKLVSSKNAARKFASCASSEACIAGLMLLHVQIRCSHASPDTQLTSVMRDSASWAPNELHAASPMPLRVQVEMHQKAIRIRRCFLVLSARLAHRLPAGIAGLWATSVGCGRCAGSAHGTGRLSAVSRLNYSLQAGSTALVTAQRRYRDCAGAGCGQRQLVSSWPAGPQPDHRSVVCGQAKCRKCELAAACIIPIGQQGAGKRLPARQWRPVSSMLKVQELPAGNGKVGTGTLACCLTVGEMPQCIQISRS